MLKEAAPEAFAKAPSWATGETSEEESGERSVEEGTNEESVEGGAGPAGSLARELRRRVFELEAQVHDLEGKVVIVDEARLAAAEHGGGGGGGKGVDAFSSRRGDCLFDWVFGLSRGWEGGGDWFAGGVRGGSLVARFLVGLMGGEVIGWFGG